jgi:ferrous iron transport protein B
MAARVIENARDRLTTILIAPLMSCSARLPVYVLLIAAFIPNEPLLGGWLSLQGVTMLAMYSIGVFTAIAVAFVLKKTILKGPVPPFVMELPSYKFPSVRLVLWRMWDRGWAFVRRAGTLIFAVTVVVWAAGYFPHDAEVAQEIETRYAEQYSELELAALETEIQNEISSAYLRQSVLGRMGRYIEPVVRPLGWDWRIGCAVIASFPAREVVIGTMGVIYNLGDEQDEMSGSLRDNLHEATWDDEPTRPVFNVPVALSIMVFFALCAQCASTLVVMRRETGSWHWPLLTFVYMTALAYLGALATYQIGAFLTS